MRCLSRGNQVHLHPSTPFLSRAFLCLHALLSFFFLSLSVDPRAPSPTSIKNEGVPSEEDRSKGRGKGKKGRG